MGQGWEEKKSNTDRKKDEGDTGVCVDLEYRMKYSSLWILLLHIQGLKPSVGFSVATLE